ncbi:primosomal protein N', partial [candidate division KSB1 bacterium]|nr:primosomal protein N' [candidate division KSB1 bacterium]
MVRRTKNFAEVVFPIAKDQSFTYRVPDELRDRIAEGFRVLVPFGRKKTTGFVVGFCSQCRLKTVKPVEDLLDDTPAFSPEILQLTRWISEYYLCSWGEVLKAALPVGINLESQFLIRSREPYSSAVVEKLRKQNPKKSRIFEEISLRGPATMAGLRRRLRISNVSYYVNWLVEEGYLVVFSRMSKPRVRVKYETVITLEAGYDRWLLEKKAEELEERAPKQAEVLRIILQEGEISRADLSRLVPNAGGALKSLVDKKVLSLGKREVMRLPPEDEPEGGVKTIILNEEQKDSLLKIAREIEAEHPGVFLLHGVTGSGKTQVYIEACAEVLRRGRTAIVLVPEISLTPQIVRRFRGYFGDLVGVQHSRLSVGERYDAWRKIKEGNYRVVVGARSAVFAPLKNLGLIALDEEQDGNFKQEEPNPRYNAREVALKRAELNGAVCILGSATPSIESNYHASRGHYQLLTLTERIDQVPLPMVTLVDMIQERKKGRLKPDSVFSQTLVDKMAAKLKQGEQIILLQNRRGFSTFIKCRECGHVETCVNCDISLTYHRRDRKLRCHYCGYERPAPTACPICGGGDIRFRGTGTQRVEAELASLFPRARVVRMDLDTTLGKGAHLRILRDFSHRKFDILLGTQMVAKGHDFPRVTLVGVISADTELMFPDFRAGERTFQLLIQAAGRSGRSPLGGEVVVQTYSPQNEILEKAELHYYEGFYRDEIEDRRGLGYPPLGRLIRIGFHGRKEKTVRERAGAFADLLREQGGPFEVLGPAPSPLLRIKNMYRYQIIL